MNYRVEYTPEGPRWIKQTWNEETEKIDEEFLPVGQALNLDPNDFVNRSNVFLFKEQIGEEMQHEDGTPYTLEELLDELERTVERKEFQPCALYNKTGDILELFWSDEGCFVEHLGNGVEICKSFQGEGKPDKIVGAKFWGLKKLLLKSYAGCDQPAKYVGIKALNPYYKPDSE
jgi:hypothetical protein